MLLGYLPQCPAATLRNQSIFISPKSTKTAQDVMIFVNSPRQIRSAKKLWRHLGQNRELGLNYLSHERADIY
jgi:hypothetical protein